MSANEHRISMGYHKSFNKIDPWCEELRHAHVGEIH